MESPASTRFLTSVDDTSTWRVASRGAPRMADASSSPASSSAAVDRPAVLHSGRRRTTSCTIESNRIGSRQRGNVATTSSPTSKWSTADGQRRPNASAVSTMYDKPPRWISMGSTVTPAIPSKQRSAIANRCTAGVRARPLRGCVAAGTTTNRSSDSASAASCATSRWPMCGGSKLPPKMPTLRGGPIDRSDPSPVSVVRGAQSPAAEERRHCPSSPRPSRCPPGQHRRPA